MWDEILFHPHTYARACCGSTGHPVSSQETRQRSYITLDFITAVLKSIYECQIIHHFPSQKCLIRKFPTSFNTAIGKILKGQCEGPKAVNIPLILRLFVGCLCKKGNRIQIAKDLVSAGIPLNATCSDSDAIVCYCPRAEGNFGYSASSVC